MVEKPGTNLFHNIESRGYLGKTFGSHLMVFNWVLELRGNLGTLSTRVTSNWDILNRVLLRNLFWFLEHKAISSRTFLGDMI